MKLINKFLLIAFALGVFTACENTDLDLLENPNAVTPENASLNDLYNNIQLEFRDAYSSGEYTPGSAARMYNAGGGYTYEANYTDATFNTFWNNVYADLFPDVDALVAIADPQGFDIHAGSAKIMKAYMMLTLVDLFANVPFSEALQGTDFISPASDPGDQIYTQAIALLDEAVSQLEGTSAAAPTVDNFYGGDASKWVKAANSLKLRAALNTGDAATINSLVSGGNIISDASDDLAFQYGSNRINPNSRHYMYQSHYEQDDGDYLSNYYMWLLVADKGFTDPRARYYFYRKVEDASAQDQTTYSCHYSTFPEQSAAPDHWEAVSEELPYCVVPGTGYSGRDHLTGEGIPPDGPIRTSYGLYPGGGQFDDDTYEDTRQSGVSGGLGQGVLPVMMASVVDLMRAEAALTLGTSDDAATMLESGIRKSMETVESFEGIVSSTMNREVEIRGGGTGTVKELYGISADKVDNYVNAVLDLFEAADADGKLDIVAKELMIAAWGNGFEAYNLYRRTGKPGNIQPGLEPAYGTFPSTFLLPAVHVTRNSKVSQKALSDRAFWDDGSADVY